MNYIVFTVMYLSYAGSINIIEEGIKDGVKNTKGIDYRFDYKNFIKDKIKNLDFKGLGDFLPLIVPIVDLMYAPLLASEIKDNMNNLKDYIKPKRYLENSLKEEKKKEEKKKEKIPLKRIFINKDHLESKYTLDEVKKLNDTTGHLYKVGTIDGEYIAIIGNYNQEENEDHKVNIVEFLFEDDVKEYKFHPENENSERLKDKLFTVYSLTHNEKLEECVNEIKLKRVRKQKEALKRLREEITTIKKDNNKTKKLK